VNFFALFSTDWNSASSVPINDNHIEILQKNSWIILALLLLLKQNADETAQKNQKHIL
jgi:hypothetical protein